MSRSILSLVIRDAEAAAAVDGGDTIHLNTDRRTIEGLARSLVDGNVRPLGGRTFPTTRSNAVRHVGRHRPGLGRPRERRACPGDQERMDGEREKRRGGFTLWFMGLSGAGKTTIAGIVERELRMRRGKKVRDRVRRDVGEGFIEVEKSMPYASSCWLKLACTALEPTPSKS